MIPKPSSNSKIQVLVADAVPMSCQLLADALQRSKHFQVAATVTPAEVLAALDGNPLQVALISAAFLDDPQGGFHLLREMRLAHPDVRAVVLLDSVERQFVVEAFRAGARGIFCRSGSFKALCKCIQCVHAGQIWVNTAELQFVLEALTQSGPLAVENLPLANPLSKREQQVARLVAEGFTNREISGQLGLSEHTVKNYLFRIFEKVGISTRVELVLYALTRGQPSRSAGDKQGSTMGGDKYNDTDEDHAAQPEMERLGRRAGQG